MKHSAITRIIIYSLVILLLVGVLGTSLAAYASRGFGNMISLFEDDEDEAYYMEAELGKTVSIGAAEVHSIEIEWVAGDLTVVPGDVEDIQLQETVSERPMIYSVRDGKLEIQFCKGTAKFFGNAKDLKGLTKDLTVTVPRDWTGNELEIHSVSADVRAQDLSVDEIEYQGVSGKCELLDTRVGELNVETVSGDVEVTGEIRELDCESVSADCSLILQNVPREIDMDGVSGKMTLVLPADAGFTVDIDGLQKDLDTDFEITMKNKKFVSGDGCCQISLDGVSSNLEIRKAK